MTDSRYTQIRERLVLARKEAGLSQMQAAHLLNMAHSAALSAYENGKREFTIPDLLRMCDVYMCSPCWVITGINPHFGEIEIQKVLDNAIEKGFPMEEADSIIRTLEMLNHGE